MSQAVYARQQVNFKKLAKVSQEDLHSEFIALNFGH